ncbi:T9SS type A sorting domain-containing protein [Gaetbulibacter aquiaggeris]|uniref:T9SS type A sorting domain-containing protein n=1 Tax=Gaetbulibacter aquiaggeris TaxID=1735373 RepID=A0ABW7MPG8_9FLAO
MKKITLLLLCLTISWSSYSQCTTATGGVYGEHFMANDGTVETIATDNWPNAEVSIIRGLVVGNTYTVTGTNTTSIYITITETQADLSIGTVINHGAASVNFTATTAQILIFWHLDAACTTQFGDNTFTTIQCIGPTCTCTDSVPNAVINPEPADGATNVALDQADPIDYPNRLYFTWVNGAGDPGTLFTLNLGTTSPPIEAAFTGFQNGDFIYYLDYNTTYYWSVDAINCAGTSSPTVWSFTTEKDPALSINEFNVQLFSVYPNPAQDIISIKTDISINNVDIFNVLGQRIIKFNTDDLKDKSMNISNLKNGVYFMKINSESKQQTIKFIKE